MTTEPENPILFVSRITEFNDISEFMNDQDLDTALDYVVKLIANPDVPHAKIARVIVQLQAISAKFGLLSKHYMIKGNKEDRARKEMYFTANNEINGLINALKYYMK